MNDFTDVDRILKNSGPDGTTLFQLRYFVVGREPTVQAKLRRCISEMRQRRESVAAAALEIEEAEDVAALHRLEMEQAGGPDGDIRCRQFARKITAGERHVAGLRERVAAWTAEILFLKDMYDQLSAAEPLRDWGDYDVQLEYWTTKLAKEISERVQLKAPVDVEILRTVLLLPDTAPVKRQLLDVAKQLSVHT